MDHFYKYIRNKVEFTFANLKCIDGKLFGG